MTEIYVTEPSVTGYDVVTGLHVTKLNVIGLNGTELNRTGLSLAV